MTMTSINEVHKFFLEIARQTSLHSPDPSTKVGAVLVSGDARFWRGASEKELKGYIIRTDYNAFPEGVIDTPERWNDRPTKYMFVLHAEWRVLLGLLRDPPSNKVTMHNTTLYVYGLPPCGECAGAIVHAGIKRVVFADLEGIGSSSNSERFKRWKESCDSGSIKFREAGVSVITLVPNEPTVKE